MQAQCCGLYKFIRVLTSSKKQPKVANHMKILALETEYMRNRRNYSIIIRYCVLFIVFLILPFIAIKIVHPSKKTSISLILCFPIVKGDVRAKNDMLNFKQPPGFHSCRFCKIRGLQKPGNNVVYFPYTALAPELRTHAEVRN